MACTCKVTAAKETKLFHSQRLLYNQRSEHKMCLKLIAWVNERRGGKGREKTRKEKTGDKKGQTKENR